MNKSDDQIDNFDGQFRYLSQLLYQSDSSDSFFLFQQNPQLFSTYHQLYQKQQKKWRVDPLILLLKFIIKNKRYFTNKLCLDLGCGEAKLAQFLSIGDSQQFKIFKSIHSYDFVSTNKFVKEQNINKLPEKNNSVGLAVFSLSLMGRDWPVFVGEAVRVLEIGGCLFVFEVLTRFRNKFAFVKKLKKLGLRKVMGHNFGDYFCLLIFQKVETVKIDSK